MDYSRREFGRLALAGAAAAGLPWTRLAAQAAEGKTKSKWAGVQVGMNVPYNFGTGNFTSGDELLQRCVDLGCSAVELRAQPVELFLGSPAAIAGAPGGDRGRGAAGAGRGAGAAGDAAGRGRAGAQGGGRADA